MPGDGGLYECPKGTYCGNPAQFNLPVDPEEYENTDFIFYGIINFDNILVGLLTIF